MKGSTTVDVVEEINHVPREDKVLERRESLPSSFYLHFRGEEVTATHPVENPTKIVLLHGFMQSHTCWLTTAYRLHRRYGHSVVLIDFFGHGRSPHLKNYKDCTAKTLVQQVRGILQRIQWDREPVCFAGLSLGGAIAQQYLLTYPNNVDRILLLASAGLSEKSRFSCANQSAKIFRLMLNMVEKTDKKFNIRWVLRNKYVTKVLGVLHLP